MEGEQTASWEGGRGIRDCIVPPLRGRWGGAALCRVDDIPDGGAKGFPPPPGGFTGLFAVRQGDAVFVYVNSCPHIGTPLDWTPDRFLSADGSRIVCATHGAEFDRRRPMHARPLLRRSAGSGYDRDQGRHHLVPDDAGLTAETNGRNTSMSDAHPADGQVYPVNPEIAAKAHVSARAIATCTSMPA